MLGKRHWPGYLPRFIEELPRVARLQRGREAPNRSTAGLAHGHRERCPPDARDAPAMPSKYQDDPDPEAYAQAGKALGMPELVVRRAFHEMLMRLQGHFDRPLDKVPDSDLPASGLRSRWR